MGGDDEWVELRNMTSRPISVLNFVVENLGSGTGANIKLGEGIISANGYFLLSHFNKNNSAIDIEPDMILTGISFVNSGEQLTLKNDFGNILDTANISGKWLAGTLGPPRKSMERKNSPGDGTLVENWVTSAGHSNMDLNATESGTPRTANGI
jgi:hypothetical protein